MSRAAFANIHVVLTLSVVPRWKNLLCIRTSRRSSQISLKLFASFCHLKNTKQYQPVQADFNEYRHEQLQDHFSTPTNNFWVSCRFSNLFPVSLPFPGSLGAFLGQKSKALKSTWRVKKVHSFSMALHAYWLPRIAYYCRLLHLLHLIALIIVAVIYHCCYCCHWSYSC